MKAKGRDAGKRTEAGALVASRGCPRRGSSMFRAAPSFFLLVFAFVLTLGAQNPIGGSVKGGFKYPNYDAQNRLKSMLTGEEAQPDLTGRVKIKKFRLETYRDDGRLDLVAEAPECTFDLATRTVSSSGELRAFTADERFSITGQGFRFAQTNSSLVISNRVHTIIRRDALTPLANKP
jgi:hypothetical protein